MSLPEFSLRELGVTHVYCRVDWLIIAINLSDLGGKNGAPDFVISIDLIATEILNEIQWISDGKTFITYCRG